MRISSKFFEKGPVAAAKALVGKRMICGECSGIVVETEAYAAENDKAAHTFTKPSANKICMTKRGKMKKKLPTGKWSIMNKKTRYKAKTIEKLMSAVPVTIAGRQIRGNAVFFIKSAC